MLESMLLQGHCYLHNRRVSNIHVYTYPFLQSFLTLAATLHVTTNINIGSELTHSDAYVEK